MQWQTTPLISGWYSSAIDRGGFCCREHVLLLASPHAVVRNVATGQNYVPNNYPIYCSIHYTMLVLIFKNLFYNIYPSRVSKI